MKTTLPGGIRARLGSIADEAESSAARFPTTARELTRIPKRKAPRPRPSRQKTHDESFRDLDAWYEEAVAGMPDDALARAANVSLTAVLAWRKAKGIRRKKGWERRQELDTWAVDAFGDAYDPELHATSSELKAQWDLPEYVLRVPLDYDQLARSVFFLHFELGSAPDAIAKALGLRARDVEMAIAVETAHLQRVGVACAACGRVCDPAYGKWCSTRCKTETK